MAMDCSPHRSHGASSGRSPQSAPDVTELVRVARSAHPELSGLIADAEFVAHLDGLAAKDSSIAQEARSPSQLAVYGGDLYLAYGCARGLPAALARFEAACVPSARAAIAKIDSRPEFIADVLQELRTRLLCRADASVPPRIASYRGRGPLTGWVRAAAVRLSLNRLRDQRRAGDVPAETIAEEDLGAAAASDPELGFIRAHYHKPFKIAFGEALSQLTSRERTLLRMQLLDGLTEEQMGAMYGAHRVTIARWLARARQKLLIDTQRLLAKELGLPSGQLESITGLVPSQLDLSLSRLLRTP